MAAQGQGDAIGWRVSQTVQYVPSVLLGEQGPGVSYARMDIMETQRASMGPPGYVRNVNVRTT